MNQPSIDPHRLLHKMFDAAVLRALPARGLAAWLPEAPRGRTVVLGAGKAGGAMAAAVDALWPADAPLSGLVVTRYDHVPADYLARPGRIEVVQAAHPVPDEAGEKAAWRMAQLAHGLTEDDLVLCLISGGGSALLSAPVPGLRLVDKQAINRALLRSGATIEEMNCVRKHLSFLKGGRLATLCAPARVVSLLISDVPGDDPAVIASGPTVPDPSTCAQALAVLRRYHIEVPAAVQEGLSSGAFETPKPGDPRFDGHSVHLVATPQASLEAAAELAREHGMAAHILSDELEGESRVVGQVHAALARAVARRDQPFARPCVILSGGETTVTLGAPVAGEPRGRGGRASEFLLSCALALQGQAQVWGLAADTDGIDGVESNAGALIGPDTLARAEAAGVSAQDCLDRHDAFSFFESLGDLVVTGPTFTNVNDFRALLIL
jgi:glycerate 2-kinase